MGDLIDPFTPRNQQSLIIADIELLAVVISVVIWGIYGEGAVHISVSDNAHEISLTNKKKENRCVALDLPGTFFSRAIRYGFKVVVYAMTYHSLADAALTRTDVDQLNTGMAK